MSSGQRKGSAPPMNAVFRREAKRLGNGATLLQWELRTSEGRVVDAALATAPSLQGGEVFFVTAEAVHELDSVTLVAQLNEIEHGRRMALYRIPRERCTIGASIARSDMRTISATHTIRR